MKAIIVDFDGKYVIVATPRGDFKRIYNRFEGFSIGDEIDIPDISNLPFGTITSYWAKKKVWVAACACLLILFVGLYGITVYREPMAFVTMDINPSIEFSLNRFDRIIEIKGLNVDGTNIIGDGKVFNNMCIEKALQILLDRAVSMDYLSLNKNTVMLAVSHVNDDIPAKLDDKLKMIAESELAIIREKLSSLPESDANVLDVTDNSDSLGEKEASFVVLVENTTMEKRDKAREMEVSQGKLLLYDKLKKVKPDITIKHIKETPVTQVMNELKELESKPKNLKKEKNNIKDIIKTEKARKRESKVIENELKKAENKAKKAIKDAQRDVKKIKKDIKNKPNKDLRKDVKKDVKKKIKELKKDTDKSRANKIKKLKEKKHPNRQKQS